jgi:DNA-binding NtrC family response regulator
MTGHVLIVDDEELYRQLLTTRLGRVGHTLSEAADGEAALEIARGATIDLALVDIKMPGMDGLELLSRLKAIDPRTEVVILTGHANVDSAISAMKLGAFDYLSKPYKLTELDITVERALEKRRLGLRCAGLSAEVAHLRGSPDSAAGIGQSPVWLDTLALARRAAPLDLPVLISGESGSGKEVIAGALHRWSPRADNAYVPLNCGLLQENLLESELFGHKKGAFTGASSDKDGLCEYATNGTLFLDEIGELPLACQAKLLRVLDSGEYRPVGSNTLRRTNARIIAATHRNLDELAANGRFRHDLLYRLNVIHVPVPALRDRRDDIPLLAEHLLNRASARIGRRLAMTPRALALLSSYSWPGNVRELRNVIERLAILTDTGEIEATMVSKVLSLKPDSPPQPVEESTFAEIKPLEIVEHDYIRWALQHSGGNISAVAAGLGISRSKIYRVLREKSGKS